MTDPITPASSAATQPSASPQVASAPDPSVDPAAPAAHDAPGPTGRRPVVERLGLAAVALLLAALFAGVAVAALAGGEVFLAAMAAIGALMTLWAGAIPVFRG